MVSVYVEVVSLAKVHVSYKMLCFTNISLSARVKHVMVTTLLLVCGAMSITWICDTISESGFGNGVDILVIYHMLRICLLLF